jgi:hypothetical protein
MNQVEGIAFWVGFIASIVGIVLSVVAIVFSILVDRRSSKISDHTIQSLQKIESAVERLSTDTREFIKAGWDKMLGNIDRPPGHPSNESSAKEVAAGIAAELRSELTTIRGEKGSADKSQLRLDELEKYLKNLEASLIAQVSAQHVDSRPSARFEAVVDMVNRLTPKTNALLRAITDFHLTQREYKSLSSGKFGSSILELRKAGLLVPVLHDTAHGPEPCYYFPSGMAKIARAVLHVLPEPTKDLQRDVAAELKSIGYPSGQDFHRHDDTPDDV